MGNLARETSCRLTLSNHGKWVVPPGATYLLHQCGESEPVCGSPHGFFPLATTESAASAVKFSAAPARMNRPQMIARPVGTQTASPAARTWPMTADVLIMLLRGLRSWTNIRQ